MKLAFFTNFINHHQTPLADELYSILGKNYTMVTFEKVPEKFLKRGYIDYSDKVYLLKAYLNEENLNLAKKIIQTYDVIVWGDAPEELIYDRIKLNKLVFRYTERFIKKIDRRVLSLNYWKDLYNKHTIFKNNNVYVLAANAFQRFDTKIIGSYPGKVLKWGYFIEVPNLNIEQIQKKQQSEKISILWCATFSTVKHPELVIKLAYQLKIEKIDFSIDMYGNDGGIMSEIKQLIKSFDVEDVVNLCGNVSNIEMQKIMQSHQIYLFTSDYGEGWGAVLSEAMGNGCCVIASDAAGATKFLVKDSYNGYTFRFGKFSDLLNKTKSLIYNPNLRTKYAINAYRTMYDVWSPQNAAKKLITLSSDILNGKIKYPESGPCSLSELNIPNFVPIITPIIKRKLEKLFK
ncbi:glycosyltransferase family 4 protein [Bacteroides ndongoniae]|uniref:glycosyltransferase family 4 protein n=1 Tax=Bacteroides ndongoniae TaxID=1903262 RepID=UPI0008D9E124|nr:glycosyltransferase [Bacteroides ndongoniae]